MKCSDAPDPEVLWVHPFPVVVASVASAGRAPVFTVIEEG